MSTKVLKRYFSNNLTIQEIFETFGRNVYQGLKGTLKDKPKVYNKRNFTNVFQYFNGPIEMEVKSMQPEDIRNLDHQWPDLMFISRDTYTNGQQYMEAFQNLQIVDNEKNRQAFYLQVDKILMRRLPLAAEGCVPPFFKHIFMHRQTGLNRVHMDIEPDVIESRLPGIGQSCECYNIWILLNKRGYGYNPCAFLYPAMIPDWREIEERRAVLQLRAPFTEEMQDPWIWWGEMNVGDMVVWKTRKGFHSGCTNDTFDREDRRYSMDFRRIYGPKGFGKKHAQLFSKLYHDHSFQHP